MMNSIYSRYKDEEVTSRLVQEIQAYRGKPLKIMEVCGTHTMCISRYGIRNLLPDTIKLISGPGCPVCVTPSYYVKAAIELARRSDVIIATFGDMLRIPYQDSSLLLEKAKGRDIRIVYTPLDCMELALAHPDKKVIFLSVGFETTIPVIALSVLEAMERGISNYMLLTANKTMPAALHLLSSDEEIGVDGYLYPGHVSAIIGTSLYDEVAERYGIPGVVTGFEPVDLLGAVYRIMGAASGKPQVENLYARVVKPEGNPIAVRKMNQVFKPYDAVWRGIGTIPDSGLRLREEYGAFDAWRLLETSAESLENEPKGCRCGDILKGKCSPQDCKLFGKACTPEKPVGSCMVSSEGTCAAYYKYG